MRRAPVVLTSTVAGLVGVLSFQPREPSVAAVASSPAPTTTTPGATSTTPSGTSTSTAAKTVTGDSIDTRYGAAQVRVTISGGRITEVQALALQGNDPKSLQISSSAAPTLRQSALTRQSADIDAVSGATITSASYEASLQSALDKAGFEAADGSRGSSTIPQVEEHRGGPGDGGPPDGFDGGGFGFGG